MANQFVIRRVQRDHADFLYSENLWDVAQRNGLWSPDQGVCVCVWWGKSWMYMIGCRDGSGGSGCVCVYSQLYVSDCMHPLRLTPYPSIKPINIKGDLDFLKVYGYMRVHAAYATRRVWRVFTVRVVACLQWGGSVPFIMHADQYAHACVWRVFTVCALLPAWVYYHTLVRSIGGPHPLCKQTNLCTHVHDHAPNTKPIIHRPDHHKTAGRPLPAPALRDGRLRGRLPLLRPARPAPNAPRHDALPGVCF